MLCHCAYRKQNTVLIVTSNSEEVIGGTGFCAKLGQHRIAEFRVVANSFILGQSIFVSVVLSK